MHSEIRPDDEIHEKEQARCDPQRVQAFHLIGTDAGAEDNERRPEFEEKLDGRKECVVEQENGSGRSNLRLADDQWQVVVSAPCAHGDSKTIIEYPAGEYKFRFVRLKKGFVGCADSKTLKDILRRTIGYQCLAV